LAGIDPGSVSLDDQVTLLQLAERSKAAVEAWQQRVLAAVEYGDGRDRDDWVREEVACALGIAINTAGSRLAVARGLCNRFPATLAGLAAGAVAYGQARALVEETDHLDDDLARRVEQRVLPKAERLPVGAFRGLVKRAADRLDPATAAERHRESRADRRVWRQPVADGMAVLGGMFAAEHVAAAYATLDEEAHRANPDDPRTVEQRRADAFIDRLTGTHPDYGAGSDDPAPTRAPRVAVDVVVSLDTLTGASNTPGELIGQQPLTPVQARALAYSPHAVWRRLVTCPTTGRMVGYSRQTYTPSPATVTRFLTALVEKPPPPVPGYRPGAALTRWVRARDRHCAFPGCRRRARGCDLDHTQPWPHGVTAVANLRPLCRRHHRLKHQAGWHLAVNPDGSWTWTSPLGRHYRDQPHDYSPP
ncbi:MAG: DUF222 domain-containing protein, partial [Streptosporangiales bacterium]